MPLVRRDFVALATAAMAGLPTVVDGAPADAGDGGSRMYGLIGKMKAVAGQRAALASILLEGSAAMPGCFAYVIAEDAADPDALWVTEVWDDPTSHKASLSLPSVQQAIARGKPLIAGFGERFETRPLGGHGLDRRG